MLLRAISLMMALAAAPLATSGRAPVADAAPVASWPYVATPDGDQLLAVDPTTLASSSEAAGSFAPPGPTRTPGTGAGYVAWLASADGATLVRYAVDLSAGGPMGRAEFTVFDAATGGVRSAFPAPEWGQQIPQLSADGRVLAIEVGTGALVHGVDGTLTIARQPTWYAFDTATGAEIARVQGDGGALAGLQRLGYLDPAGARLYRLVAVGRQEATGPWPTQVVAVDLASGHEIGRVDLPGVRSGFWWTGRVRAPHEYQDDYLTPSLAASADGRTLVVLDGDGTAATVVDTATMSVRGGVAVELTARRSFTVAHAGTGGCPATYPLCGSSIGPEVQALAMPDADHVLVGGYAAARTGEDGVAVRDYGLQLVRLATGGVAATADAPPTTVLGVVFGQRRLWPALGGEAYYAIGLRPVAPAATATPAAESAPARTILYRFDADDLRVTAERDITNGWSVSVVVLAQPLPDRWG
jgi:hypothetical protein